ncbi:MAG: hypothetical protein HQK83_02480 [Fibrobacteria bacterium]|nr:hypothetical protein [Fibrobacteria bacterium]
MDNQFLKIMNTMSRKNILILAMGIFLLNCSRYEQIDLSLNTNPNLPSAELISFYAGIGTEEIQLGMSQYQVDSTLQAMQCVPGDESYQCPDVGEYLVFYTDTRKVNMITLFSKRFISKKVSGTDTIPGVAPMAKVEDMKKIYGDYPTTDPDVPFIFFYYDLGIGFITDQEKEERIAAVIALEPQ